MEYIDLQWERPRHFPPPLKSAWSSVTRGNVGRRSQGVLHMKTTTLKERYNHGKKKKKNQEYMENPRTLEDTSYTLKFCFGPRTNLYQLSVLLDNPSHGHLSVQKFCHKILRVGSYINEYTCCYINFPINNVKINKIPFQTQFFSIYRVVIFSNDEKNFSYHVVKNLTIHR